MYSSIAEYLTTQFYSWEQRGRGWNVWDIPVDLEPPFEPFFYYYPNFQNKIDDGKQETILSSLVKQFTPRFLKSDYETSNHYYFEEHKEIVPLPYECDSAIKEIVLELPADFNINYDFSLNFLQSFSSNNFPVSFEIICLDGQIFIQLACRESEYEYLRNRLRAYFPEIVETKNRNFFQKLIKSENKTLIVDFGLSEEFMRPIRTIDNFNPDPLINAFAAFENFTTNETGIIQILFQPACFPWAESISRSVTGLDGKSFFVNAPEMLPLSLKKISSPLFAVNIRIACQSNSKSRSEILLKSLSNFLDNYSNTKSNKLIPLHNDSYDDAIHLNDLINRQTHRSGMLLNSKELVSLVHFPSPSVRSKRFIKLDKKIKPAPEIVSGNEFIIGNNISNDSMIPVSLNHTQRLKHMHIIGATGTGKSTFLLNLIHQDIQANLGVCVFDPHGDLIENILEILPNERVKDTILFNPSLEACSLGLNILEAKTEVEKDVLSSDLVSIFKRFSTSWGDQMTTVLGNTISTFLESNEGGSLLELRQFLIDDAFRKEYLKTISDSFVLSFWEKEFPLFKGNTLNSLLSRIDTLLRPKIIRNVLGQRIGLDIEEVMNENKILLIQLPQGIIGIETSHLLGSLIFSKIHQVTLRRQLQEIQKRKPFYIYLDEFQNFLTPSMGSILAGARKYSVGLILAHQDLQQLISYDSALTNSVISNAYTRVCFRLGDFDAQKLQNNFSSFDSKDLQNLGLGEAVVRIERADYDFLLKSNVLIDNLVGNKNEKIKSIIENNPNKIKKNGEVKTVSIISELKISGISDVGQNVELVTQRNFLETEEKDQEKISHHRYLQSLIKNIAEQNGYRAIIEAETPDKSGRVDVYLERENEKIACEISITTTPEHEVQNIEKCLRAGFHKILVCSPNNRHLEKIKKLSVEKLNLNDNIFFFQPEEVFKFFNEKNQPHDFDSKKIKGYRVKLNYKNLAPNKSLQKKEIFTKVILDSFQKLKG